MKIMIILGLMCSLNQANAVVSTSNTNLCLLVVQGENLPVDKMERLSYLHNQILSLPGNRDKYMKEMQDLRTQRAPHFPERSKTGTDKKVIDAAFKKWIADFPREYDMYTRGLIEMKNKYAK